MFVLLCAVTIGQIEDVSKLRESYEKTLAIYESGRADHVESLARYREMCEEFPKKEAMTRQIIATPDVSKIPQLMARQEDRLAQWDRKKEIRESHLRSMGRNLREWEITLRKLKELVDSLHWQYQQAAGWPSYHRA